MPTTGTCDSEVQKTVEVPQVQYFGRIVDVPVAIQQKAPTMMQRGFSRDDATPGSHFQESTENQPHWRVYRRLCRNARHVHGRRVFAKALGRQFSRASSYSHKVNDATSCHVECQLPEWRTLTEADTNTETRSAGGALETGSARRRKSSRRCLSR